MISYQHQWDRHQTRPFGNRLVDECFCNSIVRYGHQQNKRRLVTDIVDEIAYGLCAELDAIVIQAGQSNLIFQRSDVGPVSRTVDYQVDLGLLS